LNQAMEENLYETKKLPTGTYPEMDNGSGDMATISKYQTNGAPGDAVNLEDSMVPVHYLMDNRFEILKLIGKGGMCNVYKAFDRELKRDVAVKVLNQKFRNDHSNDILGRFRGEGSTVANLAHPDIIKIYHTFQDPIFGPGLILELVDGGSLSDLLKDKTLPARTAASIALRLARAISHAHGNKSSIHSKSNPAIIHRDLKPSNVLVSGADQYLSNPLDSRFEIKITDFGLGKNLEPTSGNHELTAHGMIVGTPSYMAPEQARGEKNLTTAVDVYGLGAILYEMLTGKPPFTGPTVSAILRQVLESEPIPPFKLVNRLPPTISAICLKCLEKEPENRYHSAEELADDLEHWLANKPIIAKVPGPITLIYRWAIKNPLLFLTITGFSILLISLISLGIFSYRQMVENETNSLKGKMHESSLSTLNSILDLLNKDSNLGRTPGLEPLHNILQKYYDKLVHDFRKEKNIDPVKFKLVDAHLSLSELMAKKGNKADCARVLESAISLLLQAQQNPSTNNPENEFLLGYSHRLLGEVLGDLGETQESLDHLNKALEIFESVSTNEATSPINLNPIEQLALTEHTLGTYYMHLDPNLSLDHYQKSIDLFAKICKEYPENISHQRNLARGYGYRGDTYMEMGDFQNADRNYWESHHLRENITKIQKITAFWNLDLSKAGEELNSTSFNLTNDQLESLFQLARSFGNFGTMHSKMSLLSTSEDFFSKSLRIREYLVKASPNIKDFKYDFAGNLVELSSVRLKRISSSMNPNLTASNSELKKIELDLDKAINGIYEPEINSDKAIPMIRGQGDAKTLMCQIYWLRGVSGDDKYFPETERFLEKKYPNAQYDNYNIARICSMRASLYQKSKNIEQEKAFTSKAINYLSSCIKNTSGLTRLEEARNDPVFKNVPEIINYLETFKRSSPE